MTKIESCTSESMPENIYKSYEVIIVSDVIQTDDGYTFTQNIYNPMEYEKYKLYELKEKDIKINELENKNNNLQETIDNQQNIVNSMADMILEISTNITV